MRKGTGFGSLLFIGFSIVASPVWGGGAGQGPNRFQEPSREAQKEAIRKAIEKINKGAEDRPGTATGIGTGAVTSTGTSTSTGTGTGTSTGRPEPIRTPAPGRTPQVVPTPVAQPRPGAGSNEHPSDLPGGGAGEADDNRSGNKLVVDLRKGSPVDGGTEGSEMARLKALVFAINSLNTENDNLLTVEQLLKTFPGGKIPKEGDAKVSIELSSYLTGTQRRKLRQLLLDDPFSCNRERDLASGVRVDSIVSNIFDPSNYTDLLGIKNRSRRQFEQDLGVSREFDGDPNLRDTSNKTMRLLLAPGDSGITHDNAFRKIVLQKQQGRGKDGLLLIRTEDSEKRNASKRTHNFAEHPVHAQGDAHEEIWELPNGMRAYALRNRAGDLQTAAPPTLVKRTVVNPVSCMKCHNSGFIATKGDTTGQSKEADELKKLDLNQNEPDAPRGLAGKQFSASPKDYGGAIDVANARMKAALEKSGVGKPKDFAKFYGGTEDGGYRLDELAKEFGVEPAQIGEVIGGDRSFKNVLNVADFAKAMKNFAETKKPEDLPTILRDDLQRDVRVGTQTQSLYCTLKQRLVGLDEARRRRRNASDDEDVHARVPGTTSESRRPDSHL